MGAARKREIMGIRDNPFLQQITCYSNPHSARHLRKDELAGVIFGCTHSTYRECVFKQLFGLPASHIKYVRHITPGMPVFLFNYNDRTLHGLFEATSAGQLHVNKYAWTLDGQKITPYPAQVRVKICMQCQPLTENLYKPILAKNYPKHEPTHLWFELDQLQTHELISLFSSSPVSPCVLPPVAAAKWGTLFRQSTGPTDNQDDCSSVVTDIEDDYGEVNSGAILDQDVAKGLENIPERKWSSIFIPQYNVPPSKECDDSNSETLSTMSEDDHASLSEPTAVNETPLVICERTNIAEAPTAISEATCSVEDMSTESNSDIREAVNKLTQAMRELKDLQAKQTMKIQNLELELEEANSKLRKSEFHHQKSTHSGSSFSDRHSEEMQLENQDIYESSDRYSEEMQLEKQDIYQSSDRHSEEMQLEIQDIYQSILLLGGFDGSSWLQNLDCYCPFEDAMRPLSHMKSARSYASAVELDGELYVVGGGFGSSWCDTVESYNLKSKQWVSCPSLNRKKGNLASVSLLSKIFAIGGGDSDNCFSEVEVLDFNAGKWIVTRSMFQKRFAPAAAELNGVLYVAGGYDGKEYLSSVERFDPRVFSWMKLKSMNSRRGCYSLTVLNEKLYAIGGYDGTQMVPTVEVFDPRIGSWSMLESMKFARSGLSSVNFGESIYVIGGMQENNDIIDTVECYSEAEGWKLMQQKSIGKRCFTSVIAI